MKVLGISCFYHDSAVAAVEDGAVRFAIHEERITRTKHDSGFPAQGVRAALRHCNWDIRDVDLVAFYERPQLKLQRLEHQVRTDFFRAFNLWRTHLPNFRANKLNIEAAIRANLHYSGDISLYEHHFSHAASSFFASPFEEALVVTVDGVGEWDCLGIYQGQGNRLAKRESIRFPHSLGLFYSVFTHYLGFRVNSGEYKVMGMACYGEPAYFDRIMANILRLKPGGTFELNQKYFNFSDDRMHSTKALTKLIGLPLRTPETPVGQDYYNLAASVQKALEEALLHVVGHALKRYPTKNLCLAGGVALNCTANSRLIRELGVVPFIQPAAGDAGGALGAALAASAERASGLLRCHPFDPYLGVEFTDAEVEETLKRRGVPFWKSGNLAREAAQLLAAGKIVAVHHGRDEWGPRALGNRSILADPTVPGMQDHLNAKIKFRESFRPFAPIVVEESYGDYFETLGMDSTPYMLFTHKVKRPEAIPAVTHVDGTGRAQTVSAEQNHEIYAILREFEKIKGVPVLINTSFNLRGEPIVHSPDDALNTFATSGIDHLAVNDFIVAKD